ncbi:hypothetical protein [Sulfobacillus sp. hq2]|uniref:hypothetical protein n=1 Tax=Sulfobacillus TaxID=28033 RepID=UPI000CD07D98|nr:hypothetical protein [Sulfobacillus sp. hq2]POB11427.1 hypothetical protein CO251_04600 [Sulfobacillus sp. hq2]
MGPFIQELVLKGHARIYETDAFVPISSNYPTANTQTVELEAPANYVWIVYEVDMEPADVNNSIQIYGPNIGSGVTLRAQNGPIAGAFLATDTAAFRAVINNNTSSSLAVAFRYIELTTEWYTLLVNPNYQGESKAWKKAVAAANSYPANPNEGVTT